MKSTEQLLDVHISLVSLSTLVKRTKSKRCHVLELDTIQKAVKEARDEVKKILDKEYARDLENKTYRVKYGELQRKYEALKKQMSENER
jgi:uncharacterized protein (DUF3084 family)